MAIGYPADKALYPCLDHKWWANRTSAQGVLGAGRSAAAVEGTGVQKAIVCAPPRRLLCVSTDPVLDK